MRMPRASAPMVPMALVVLAVLVVLVVLAVFVALALPLTKMRLFAVRRVA